MKAAAVDAVVQQRIAVVTGRRLVLVEARGDRAEGVEPHGGAEEENDEQQPTRSEEGSDSHARHRGAQLAPDALPVGGTSMLTASLEVLSDAEKGVAGQGPC